MSLINSCIPISMRGLLILLAVAYLALGPASESSDIVVAALSTLTGTIMAVLFSYAFVARRLFLKLDIVGVSALANPSSREPNKIFSKDISGILLEHGKISVPPFFRVQLTPLFSQDSIEKVSHSLSGHFNESDTLIIPVSFPHRGRWECRGFLVEFQDVFGLTYQKFDKIFTAPQIFAVSPPPDHAPDLPLISSTLRPGDEQNHELLRMGDLFDLKQYHPSDGVKRILWKVFAKQGELIARHPERSVTPEGHILGYILARKEDDSLATWATNYVRAVESQRVTVSFGCLGMSSDSTWAGTSAELEEALIRYALRADTRLTPQTIRYVTEQIASHAKSTIEGAVTIGLFIDELSIDSKEVSQKLLELSENLEQRGIQCEFFLRLNFNREHLSHSWSRIRKLFFESVEQTQNESHSSQIEAASQFINLSAIRGNKIHQDKNFSRGSRR